MSTTGLTPQNLEGTSFHHFFRLYRYWHAAVARPRSPHSTSSTVTANLPDILSSLRTGRLDTYTTTATRALESFLSVLACTLWQDWMLNLRGDVWLCDCVEHLSFFFFVCSGSASAPRCHLPLARYPFHVTKKFDY